MVLGLTCGFAGVFEGCFGEKVCWGWALDDGDSYSLPRLMEGRAAMICWVSRETVMTWSMRRRMYLGSSSRLGSLTMPERGSVETRYWIDDPFEGGAVAEAVVEGSGWDAAEGEEVVVAEFGFAF